MPPQLGRNDRRSHVLEPGVGVGDRPDRLEEAIDLIDAPGEVPGDFQVLLVSGEHLPRRGRMDLKPLVEVSAGVMWPLEIQPWLADQPHRPPKLGEVNCLRLVHDDDRAQSSHHSQKRQDGCEPSP